MAGQLAVFKYRRQCHDIAQQTHFGEIVQSGLNKSAYWLGQGALHTAFLEAAWAQAAAGSSELPELTGQLSENAVKLGMEFFSQRYLQGLAVLDVEVRRVQGQGKPKAAVSLPRVAASAVRLLQTCVGNSIESAWAARAGATFRRLGSADRSKRQAGQATYQEALEALAVRGLGHTWGAAEGPAFVKRHYKHVSEAARAFLKDARVPLWSFGLGCNARGGGSAGRASTSAQAPEVAAAGSPGQTQEDRPRAAGRKPKGSPRPQEGAEPRTQPVAAATSKAARSPAAPLETTLFDGAPPQPIATTASLFKVLRQILSTTPAGATRVRLRRQERRSGVAVAGRCGSAQCDACTWRMLASSSLDPQGRARLVVRTSGEHGARAAPQGTALLTLQQQAAAEAAFPNNKLLSAPVLRAALEAARTPFQAPQHS